MFSRLKKQLSRFAEAKRGVSIVAIVITVMVAMLIGSYVLPDALEVFFAVNTTNWSSASSNMWGTIPTFSLLAIMLAVIGLAVAKYRAS